MRFIYLLLGAAISGLAAPAATAPLSLFYEITDLGGSYRYDFNLIADNNDGTFLAGMEWDWIVIGDHAPGRPVIFPEINTFFTSLPAGWQGASSGGSSNGPTLAAVDGRVTLPGWRPALGESVSFSGQSTALVPDGALTWSAVILGGGATGITREVALNTMAQPIPVPGGLALLVGGVLMLGVGRGLRRLAPASA